MPLNYTFFRAPKTSRRLRKINIRKKIKPHSAKLKINLQPSSAQLGPPCKVLYKPPKKPLNSIVVSRGIPQPDRLVNPSDERFWIYICLLVTTTPKIRDPKIRRLFINLNLLFRAAIKENKANIPKTYLVRMHKGQAYKAKIMSIIQARDIIPKPKIALFK